MKTSVIEVHDLLSLQSVLGVEERIGKVPGVESVTVNYATGNATVRYDEARLAVADIKSAVRQRPYDSEGKSPPKHVSAHESTRKLAIVPTPDEGFPVASSPTVAPGTPAAVPLRTLPRSITVRATPRAECSLQYPLPLRRILLSPCQVPPSPLPMVVRRPARRPLCR
ncbi:heavy-metal-associated domain-containing protein [Cupriavidus sp. 8B]